MAVSSVPRAMRFVSLPRKLGNLRNYLLPFASLKRSETALRQSEQRLRAVIGDAPVILWAMDRQGVITLVEGSGLDYLGTNPGQLVGRSVFRVFRNMPQIMQDSRRALAGAALTSIVEIDQLTFESRYSPVLDENGVVSGIIGVAIDITDRRRAEKALSQSETNYRTLVESSPDGVVSVNTEGHIIDCNQSICRLLGYSKEEIVGKRFRHLLANPRKEDLEFYYSQVTENIQLEDEFELRHKDGQAIPVWAKMVWLLDSSGCFDHSVVYLRDIAERKKVDQLKDEFIGLVSHELRSPLTVIMGAIHTALSERDRLSREETRQLLQDAALVYCLVNSFTI